MSPVALLLVLLALAALMALARKGVFTKGRPVGSHHWPVFQKRVLSPIEQQLYQRLVRAFPEHVVLAQVAYSQLVGVRKGENFTAIWNRYNRLVADFVLCTKDFRTVAVLELDDRSHDNPARQDADRRKAAICEAAGISLHRLNVNPLPNESELRALLQLPPLPQRAPVLHLRDGAPR